MISVTAYYLAAYECPSAKMPANARDLQSSSQRTHASSFFLGTWPYLLLSSPLLSVPKKSIQQQKVKLSSLFSSSFFSFSFLQIKSEASFNEAVCIV